MIQGKEHLRHERRASAIMALEYLDPQDAATICAAVLESMATEGPQHDLLGRVRGDAALWAECATTHEVAAYTVAGLGRLRQSPMGIHARKAIFAELWNGFSQADRTAFLNKVDGNARFAGKAA